MGITIKYIIRSYFTLEVYTLYQLVMLSTYLKATKFNSFEDKNLSQGLTSILHNTLEVARRGPIVNITHQL